MSKLEVRKRLLNDFEFWCKHCAKIRTKEGEILPLIFNEVQQRFVKRINDQLKARGRVRFVVLKARQQGLSTIISAFQYWWISQHRAVKGLVMAHEADSTTSLFDMYQRLHDNCPAWVKPETKYSSRTELVFAKLDSGLRVATAGGRGVARGETLQFAHLSEVAFWPPAFSEKNFNGLIQAVPEVPGTAAFVESTAQGVTGKFHHLWNHAEQMGYEQFFSGWNESSEYRETAPADFERTPDEADLAALYDLDNDQLYWRRRKIAANGFDLFRQEYPLTPEEAFISTGRPVFNIDYVLERLRTPKSPIMRMAVDFGSVVENPRGELLVYKTYKNPDTGRTEMVSPSENYVVGADPGMGVQGGDYSVAQILDTSGEQVAVWRGIIHSDAFARVLSTLGYYYNTAVLCVERNNHGLLTCVKLRDLGYPMIWTDQIEGNLQDQDTIRIGFYTDERTKPLIIDKLRAWDRDREVKINDPQTLREMQTYVISESGKIEAEAPNHDDCVIALALAVHAHEGRWEIPDTPEELYSEAI